MKGLEFYLKLEGPPEVVLVVELAGPLIITCSRFAPSESAWAIWDWRCGLESMAICVIMI